MSKENTTTVNEVEPSTGTGETSEQVEGTEAQKENNITLEQIQKIISDSIAANNKHLEEIKEENKQLKQEKILNIKMNDLKDNELDPSLVVLLSDEEEEREQQIEILKDVIEKVKKEAVKTDMQNNPFNPDSNRGIGLNEGLPFATMTPFEKMIREGK